MLTENPPLPIVVFVAANDASISEKHHHDLINQLRAAGYHTAQWHTDAKHLARGGACVIYLRLYAGDTGDAPALVSRVRARYHECSCTLQFVTIGEQIEVSRNQPTDDFVSQCFEAVQRCATQPDRGWYRPLNRGERHGHPFIDNPVCGCSALVRVETYRNGC